jgi:hypothetical protein
MVSFTTNNPLGTSVSTSEIDDGAITNNKVNATAGIVYTKLSLTGSIASTDLASGILNINVLGSGTFTSTDATGAYEDAGNFSTAGDIGNGVVTLIVWANHSTGTGNFGTYLHNASGNAQTFGSNAAGANSGMIMKYEFTKSANADNKSNVVLNTKGTITYVVENTAFINNSAETYYIKSYAEASQVTKLRWIAYLTTP